MNIRKGDIPSPPKKESNQANSILCETPEKVSKNLKLLQKMKMIHFR